MHQIINEILESTRKRLPKTIKKGTITPRDFKEIANLRKQQGLIPVIAEVKPSSPSRFIKDVTPNEAREIARQMEAAGAAAISVLTEPEFFKGNMENLESVRKAVKIPVLRKDFIIDKSQVYEAESDLILLIAGILGNKLNEFVKESVSSGREPLIEVHNREELEIALSTDAHIIGINNRDLTTMKVDLGTTEKLAPLITDKIIISESGISNAKDAIRMIDAGVDAVLVGTSIMQGNIYEKTYELVHAFKR